MINRITLTFIIILAVTFQVLAQRQQFGHLTIFSEDGDKFTLFLNGEQINDQPQTNLRVEELTQPYYNAKIVFEDNTKAAITKNSLEIADIDDVFMDVTYKIKRDKNSASKMKLNFYSMAPIVRGFVAPSNVHVQTYGRPQPQIVQSTGNVQSTTTTTTVANSGMAVGGVGVNLGGVGVNVSIVAPVVGTTITETTTVTSTGNAGIEIIEDGCRTARPMSASNFAAALQTVKNQNFDDTRLKTAKQIAAANCLSATQISDICKIFGFEESRLEFAKMAYDSCTEQNNYFKVNNVFSFSTSVDSLTEYIQSR